MRKGSLDIDPKVADELPYKKNQINFNTRISTSAPCDITINERMIFFQYVQGQDKSFFCVSTPPPLEEVVVLPPVSAARRVRLPTSAWVLTQSRQCHIVSVRVPANRNINMVEMRERSCFSFFHLFLPPSLSSSTPPPHGKQISNIIQQGLAGGVLGLIGHIVSNKQVGCEWMRRQGTQPGRTHSVSVEMLELCSVEEKFHTVSFIPSFVHTEMLNIRAFSSLSAEN